MTPELKEKLEAALKELSMKGSKRTIVRFLEGSGFQNRQTKDGEYRSRTCPVAQFLHARTGEREIIVSKDYARYGNEFSSMINLPTNVSEAISQLDEEKIYNESIDS